MGTAAALRETLTVEALAWRWKLEDAAGKALELNAAPTTRDPAQSFLLSELPAVAAHAPVQYLSTVLTMRRLCWRWRRTGASSSQ